MDSAEFAKLLETMQPRVLKEMITFTQVLKNSTKFYIDGTENMKYNMELLSDKVFRLNNVCFSQYLSAAFQTFLSRTVPMINYFNFHFPFSIFLFIYFPHEASGAA